MSVFKNIFIVETISNIKEVKSLENFLSIPPFGKTEILGAVKSSGF
jgi:hypothetical protein